MPSLFLHLFLLLQSCSTASALVHFSSGTRREGLKPPATTRATTLRRRSSTTLLQQAVNNNNNNLPIDRQHDAYRYPPNVKFLGFHNKQSIAKATPRPTTTTKTTSTQLISTTDGALMPDGGLSPCVIKVIGVGGGGCNAVDRMLDTAVGGVDFWALNTDAQALGRSKAKGAKVLNIGALATRGLGAGGNPALGQVAAEESRPEIASMVAGTDLCFVTSGMGGGTGSGAAPVVAEIAKEEGCLTVGIVTKPFAFEGKRRMKQAIAAIDRLRENVDTVIVVSNDRLLEIIPDDTPMERAFAVADDILRQGVVGISDIIVKPGLINVDFADVRSIMSGAGTALMGIGIGSGKTAAQDAALAAISSPLLDSTIENAKGVVFNISGGPNLSLSEVNQAAKLIYSTVEADANVIFGALVDETLEDNISITVLATGFTERGREDSMEALISSDIFADENSGARGRMYNSRGNNVIADTNSNNNSSGSGIGRRRQLSTAASVRDDRSPFRSSNSNVDAERKDKDVKSSSSSKKQDDSSGGGDNKVPAFLRNLKKQR